LWCPAEVSRLLWVLSEAGRGAGRSPARPCPGLGLGWLWWREGAGFLVGLAGAQAVMELAEHAVEQVAQRGGVVLAGGSAPVVVGSGAG
jgi:hypothetical protein